MPEISTVDGDLSYPEGLLLHNGELFVAEIDKEHLIVYDTERFSRKRIISLNRCGPTAIAPFRDSSLLVNCHLAERLAILSAAGEPQGDITKTADNKPIPWANDSTSDGAGGVFLTSSGLFDLRAPATGEVMHVLPNGLAIILVEKLHYANGITYDAATRELFVTEHFENRVLRYVLDEQFKIVEGRTFFDMRQLPAPDVTPFPRMGPDNLHFRANGDLIVPNYGGGRFIIVSRSGKLRQIVNVPCQFITDAVEFRGDILFIGAYDLNTSEPKGLLGRVHGLVA